MVINPMWMQSLSVLMSLILGRDVWSIARDTVSRLLTTDMSSEEKRVKAGEELRDRGVALRTALINLAIEAAYVWITSRNGRTRPERAIDGTSRNGRTRPERAIDGRASS